MAVHTIIEALERGATEVQVEEFKSGFDSNLRRKKSDQSAVSSV